ncbi:MAG: hypothetical protein V4650_04245 [Pseudomonadota bacterium]
MFKKMLSAAVGSSMLLLSLQANATCPYNCIPKIELIQIAGIIKGGTSAAGIQAALMQWSQANIPQDTTDYEYQQFMAIYNSIGSEPLARVFDSLQPVP